ncbi:penicillin binding transpeptidase domain protein [Chlamydia ibidis]|uniref:Penicillin binding transpeptidase domain protein n=2 Tax=Chlamydia ibidis TaxID=1405396 RepID=S7KFR9_9CHLA|nr:penicillin-binding protein 2 [Chlamydia ibidis]EPP35036.1 penicillin binding transpeptidase domain protein [Chlamydia ibidis]EQM62541.1 penicillin binding transpeptidase domain protein [Chlamydia ibidis 10-1398/6]
MNHHKSLTVIITAILVSYALLIVRYYKIQICEEQRWAAEALGQHEFRVRDPFRRGTFFANTTLRKGEMEQKQAFAIDITKFHLCVDAVAIPEIHRDVVASSLLNCVGHGDYESLRKEFDKKSRHRKLFLWLDVSVRDRILSWWRGYAAKNKLPSNALFFISDYQRSYPLGKLLGQVLHTLREIKDEKTGKAFPTGGLEAYFNHILEGEPGERKYLRSPLNRLDLDRVTKIPKDGSDIYLTVNPSIQTIAEEELEIGVKEARAKGGRLVLMNSHTGEILALAQYPFFYPSNYKEYFNDLSKVECTKVSAVCDVFEPGSIMKPVTIAIALLANEEMRLLGKSPIFDPHEPIDVTRALFPGRKHSPLRDIVRNNKLNMYMAIQKSSNVYMAQLADRIIEHLGNHWYEEKLIALGFGRKTGIELPGEAVGLVPSPKRFHISGIPEWSLSTPYSLAIGYNLLVTSMQMVRAYAILANGGYDVRPTLVKKIVIDTGEEYQLRSKERSGRVLPDCVVNEVMQAMRFTTCTGGTGFRASPKRHSSAGKTGTTEKLINGRYDKHRHISSFIGITPIYPASPNIVPMVMLVSIDDPEHGLREDGTKNYMGGRCAAPVFARVADRVLNYLGAPEDKEKYSYREEVASIKSLYESWNRSQTQSK